MFLGILWRVVRIYNFYFKRFLLIISIGFDLAATFPRYINIRRGAYITAIVSIACNPWKLVNTATTFLTVLSSYSVFLGPMTGLMIASYFFVNKGKIKVEDLFIGDSSSIYWYTWGVDWRAVVGVSVPEVPFFLFSWLDWKLESMC